MKLKQLGLILLITVQACAQQKPSKVEKELLNYYKQIKHTDNKVSYHATISSSNCSFELRVNDVYVYNYYGIGGISTAWPLNGKILKAGPQTFSVRILPPRLKNGDFAKTLPKDASFYLEIEGSVIKRTGGEDLESTVFNLPTKAGINNDGAETQIFKDEGMPFGVYGGVFNAEVPYTLTGWSKSVDLREEDPDKLLEEALALYNKTGQALVKGDYFNFFTLTETKIKEVSQGWYNDSLGMIQDLKLYTEIQDFENLRLKKIENFNMQYFGEGRMIGLYGTKGNKKGKPSLQINYEEDGSTQVSYFFLHLHRPKKDGPLEIIR